MEFKNILNIWGQGQLLSFSGVDGKTDLKNGIVAKTSFDGTGIDIKAPGNMKILFSENKPENVQIAGDFFIAETEKGICKAVFLDVYHLLIAGDCNVRDGDDSLEIMSKGNRTLIGTKTKFDCLKIDADIDLAIENRKSWLKSVQVPENLSENTSKTLAKALSMMKNQVYTPEGQITTRWTSPDKWPHKYMWLWDSVFHAIGLRHIDSQLAREAIDAVLCTQKPDGMISHCMEPDNQSDITQPPVLALGVKLVNEVINDTDWIKEVYPKLCKYIQWDIDNRDSDNNNLVEWDIEANEVCRSGESGMDNSPRFDSATQLDATDFNSFLALECEILAEFADMLELEEDKVYWQSKHKTICEAMNEKLWNDKSHFYVDFDLATQKQTPILASSGFLPLICGAPSLEQAKELVNHLSNEDTFRTEIPVPSIAKCCSDFYSKDMWRGPVWININWLIAFGLKRYGFNTEAEQLLKETTKLIEQRYLESGTIFEFYDDKDETAPPDLLRKGENVSGSPFNQVIHDYGWSATLYTDIIFC